MDRPKTGRWLMTVLISSGLSGCQSTGFSSEGQPWVQNTSVNTMVEEHSGPADRQKAALVNAELGLGYLAQGQVARAKSKLNHALKLAPQCAETHSAMAYFLENVGEPGSSEKAHQKAIQLSKEKGAVYNNYGAFLCRQARFQEADQAFHQALSDKRYLQTAEVYENAGICALKARNHVLAEHYFQAAHRHDPGKNLGLLE